MGMGWPKSPRLEPDVPSSPDCGRAPLALGFCAGTHLCCAVVWVIETRTTLGYEIRAVGQNPRAARFAGIPVNIVLLKTALLSGGLAALAGFFRGRRSQGILDPRSEPGLWLHWDHRCHAGAAAPNWRSGLGHFRGGRLCRCGQHEPCGWRTHLYRRHPAGDGPFVHSARHLADPLSDRERLMDLLEILLSASFWAAAVRIASPLIFATMGELICERAGVLNLGIEGIMVVGRSPVGWQSILAPVFGQASASPFPQACCSGCYTRR